MNYLINHAYTIGALVVSIMVGVTVYAGYWCYREEMEDRKWWKQQRELYDSLFTKEGGHNNGRPNL